MVLEAGASLPSRLQGRLLPALSGLRELLASLSLQSWPLSHQGPLPVITETTPSVPAPRWPCPQGTGRGSGPPCCSGSSLVTSAKTISKQGLVHRCGDQDLTVLGTQFSAPAWLLQVTGEHKSLHSSRSFSVSCVAGLRWASNVPDPAHPECLVSESCQNSSPGMGAPPGANTWLSSPGLHHLVG